MANVRYKKFDTAGVCIITDSLAFHICVNLHSGDREVASAVQYVRNFLCQILQCRTDSKEMRGSGKLPLLLIWTLCNLQGYARLHQQNDFVFFIDFNRVVLKKI